MTAASQYISRKNKICHRYSQYILSLWLKVLIFWDTCFIKIEKEKSILEVIEMTKMLFLNWMTLLFAKDIILSNELWAN